MGEDCFSIFLTEMGNFLGEYLGESPLPHHSTYIFDPATNRVNKPLYITLCNILANQFPIKHQTLKCMLELE